MTTLALLLLTFGAGASITRLITRDSVTQTVRERWSDHFAARQDPIIQQAANALPADKRYTTPELRPSEKRMGVLHAIGERSDDEQAALAWRKRGPWSAMSYRLIRLRTYQEFIFCPWCVGTWVFAVVWFVAWAAALDFSSVVLGGPWWLVLPALVLSYRWLYALMAGRWDGH